MLNFHLISEDSIPQIAPYLCENPTRFCDYTAVNLFTWAGKFYTAYAIRNDMLFLQLSAYGGNTPMFSPPIGHGDFQEALKVLRAHCEEIGIPFRLSLVSEEQLPLITAVCGNKWRARAHRDWCDYLYDAKAMAAYEGKAYAKQRNHLRRFEKTVPQARVEQLQPEHLPLIGEFLQAFAAARDTLDAFAMEEIALTTHALAHATLLGLFGVVLFAEDRLIGFSAGCRSGDTLVVNFEKADISYDGVYQMLVKAFAERFVTEEIHYINREEDCGVEGLRRSKSAYHPLRLLGKYTLEFHG